MPWQITLNAGQCWSLSFNPGQIFFNLGRAHVVWHGFSFVLLRRRAVACVLAHFQSNLLGLCFCSYTASELIVLSLIYQQQESSVSNNKFLYMLYIHLANVCSIYTRLSSLWNINSQLLPPQLKREHEVMTSHMQLHRYVSVLMVLNMKFPSCY